MSLVSEAVHKARLSTLEVCCVISTRASRIGDLEEVEEIGILLSGLKLGSIVPSGKSMIFHSANRIELRKCEDLVTDHHHSSPEEDKGGLPPVQGPLVVISCTKTGSAEGHRRPKSNRRLGPPNMNGT